MLTEDGVTGHPINRAARASHLIQGYPKGLGIIKEFLQNADDAGATTVQIVMDWRKHSTSCLPAPALERLCGPALIIVNDAVFTDTDFDNVLALGRAANGSRAPRSESSVFGLTPHTTSRTIRRWSVESGSTS